MQLQLVSSYKRLLASVADIIDVSGYRHDYIAKKLGIKPQNFSTKKKKASWTPDELEKLLIVIDNEDVENFLLHTSHLFKQQEIFHIFIINNNQ